IFALTGMVIKDKVIVSGEDGLVGKVKASQLIRNRRDVNMSERDFAPLPLDIDNGLLLNNYFSAKPVLQIRVFNHTLKLFFLRHIWPPSRSALLPRSPRSALRCPVAGQAIFEMPFHVRPLSQENAVHHAVAHRPITAGAVVAEDAVLLGPQGLDRPLRGE